MNPLLHGVRDQRTDSSLGVCIQTFHVESICKLALQIGLGLKSCRRRVTPVYLTSIPCETVTSPAMLPSTPLQTKTQGSAPPSRNGSLSSTVATVGDCARSRASAELLLPSLNASSSSIGSDYEAGSLACAATRQEVATCHSGSERTAGQRPEVNTLKLESGRALRRMRRVKAQNTPIGQGQDTAAGSADVVKSSSRTKGVTFADQTSAASKISADKDGRDLRSTTTMDVDSPRRDKRRAERQLASEEAQKVESSRWPNVLGRLCGD